MSDESIHVEIQGLTELKAKLSAVKVRLSSYISQAMSEASKNILDTEGLKKYPPATAANQPPTPYYKRGVGTQYKSHNDGRSEKYGSHWRVDKTAYAAKISNSVSYAKYLAGDDQAKAMGKIGWRKLREVVTENIPMIKRTLEAWINKAISDAGLK